MQSDRWNLLEQLFAESLALPAVGRDEFLRRRCADDDGLRREIEALLRAHEAPGVLDSTPHAAEPAHVQASLPSGTCLGAWRIEKLVGRGGMGEVYAAARTDGAFEQRAALKLLRYEAVGQMDRFHAERQILARLEHPGIARLLDGGVAADGRPYTVMEFVEGVSLTEYCRGRHSALTERLALFAQVCDAVAYAHRNLVIHRDLKPDNILVDATGTVKLLDFGIAKLLDAAAAPSAADITIAPFTPDYAAPEQLSGQPVTTATDIYALGVLLFELLTGERPLRARGLPSTQAMSVVLDRMAPLPSRIADGRADAPVATRLLLGDLDAIVAKCLRKEAMHRYETVNGLKRDLQNHQRHEPVLAREGARLYVFGRLLRRYRWAVAVAAALIVTLAAGLAGTIWQARRAETQARTSVAVQGFLSDLFRANSSSQGDPLKARQTTARELLDLGAKKIDTAMADAPAAKLNVLILLGQLYEDLAMDDEVVRLRRQAVALARTLYGADSRETVEALVDLAASMHASSAVNEREKTLAEAAEILDRQKDFSSATRAALLQMQAEHYNSSDAPRALGFAQQSVRLHEAMPPTRQLAEALYVRGLIEENRGTVRDAMVSYSRAIEVSRAADGDPNPSLPRFHAYLGQVAYRVQDIALAEKSMRLALLTALAINGEDHVDTLQTEMRLGRMLFDTGRTKEGMALLLSAKQHALKIRDAGDPFHTPQTLLEHGYAQTRMGFLEDGLIDMEKAIANRRANRPGTFFLATMLEDAGAALVELGQTEKASAYLDEAAAIKAKGGMAPRTAPYNFGIGARIQLALATGKLETARTLIDDLFVDPDETQGISFTAIEQWLLTAEVDLAAGRRETTVETARRVRDKIEKSGLSKYMSFYTIRADLLEGQTLLQNGEPAGALPLLMRTLAAREALLGPSSPRIAEAQIALAECYLTLGDVQQARSLATAAASIHASHPMLGQQYRGPLKQLQARLGAATMR